MQKLNKETISPSLVVCFLPTPWPQFWAQGLFAAMADHVSMLLVEPPIDILSSIIRPGRLIKRLMRYRKLTKLNQTLYLFQPISLVSYGVTYRFPLFTQLSRFILRSQLKRVLSKMPSYEHLIMHYFMPQQHYALNLLKSDLSIFDIADEFYVKAQDEEIDFKRKSTIRYRQYEKKVFDNTDLVFVSSRSLYNSRSRLHSNIVQIPVGCADFEFFSKARDLNLSIPTDIASLSSPRVGFVGNFNEKVDLKLLLELARQKSDISLIFVGADNGETAFKRTTPYRELMGLPNVYHLGWHPYESLPAYIKALDVCLMPFCLNVWMKNSHPSKTYQYLSAGKPVVSTAIPEVLSLDNVIAVAKNTQDFINAVEVAINKRDAKEDIEKRVEIGFQNSSKVRAKQRAKVIVQSLKKQLQEVK